VCRQRPIAQIHERGRQMGFPSARSKALIWEEKSGREYRKAGMQRTSDDGWFTRVSTSTESRGEAASPCDALYDLGEICSWLDSSFEVATITLG